MGEPRRRYELIASLCRMSNSLVVILSALLQMWSIS